MLFGIWVAVAFCAGRAGELRVHLSSCSLPELRVLGVGEPGSSPFVEENALSSPLPALFEAVAEEDFMRDEFSRSVSRRACSSDSSSI